MAGEQEPRAVASTLSLTKRRNVENGNRIIKELKQRNPEGEAFFIQKDVTLFKNVDEVCAELTQREKKIHCLFLTAGYMTLKGRAETEEGVDRKMAVNYYSRMRFALKLMPLLERASQVNGLARVITVLAAGSEGDVRLDDLELKHNFTLHACLAHCVIMSDFMISELSKRFPSVSFSHSYPGTVKTGIANELSGPVRLAVKVLYAVMTPWILNVQESGERHLFQITSQVYPSRKGAVGVPPPDGLTAFKGIDGQLGGGAYLLDWDGKSAGDEKVLQKYREIDMGSKVWDHTLAIFEQAAQKVRQDSAMPMPGAAPDGSIPNPIGWRAA